MTVQIACVVLTAPMPWWSAEYGYTWTLMADPEGNEFDLGKAL